jgi:hypothetical protein
VNRVPGARCARPQPPVAGVRGDGKALRGTVSWRAAPSRIGLIRRQCLIWIGAEGADPPAGLLRILAVGVLTEWRVLRLPDGRLGRYTDLGDLVRAAGSFPQWMPLLGDVGAGAEVLRPSAVFLGLPAVRVKSEFGHGWRSYWNGLHGGRGPRCRVGVVSGPGYLRRNSNSLNGKEFRALGP